MSISEGTIPEDKDTGQLPDDPSVSSNEDQANDPDEFSSLPTDEAEISMQAETPLAKEVNDDSTLEEPEVLQASSGEVTTDGSESIFDEVSVLKELEDMYASSSEPTGENSETVSNIEASATENVSTGHSVLEELDALLSDNSVESVVNLITGEVETSKSAEHSSNEGEAGDMSALDELKAFSDETEINNSESVSDTSVSIDEVDEYLSPIESDDGDSSNDETIATDSVPDDLNELLVKSDNTGTEIPVADTEKSVPEEFASYMDGSSDLPAIDVETSADETEIEAEMEAEIESAFDEVDNTSDTLEQVEVMLNESSGYTDDEPGKTIQFNEDDSAIEYEAPQLSANNEEEKHEDVSELKNRIQPDDVKTESLMQNSLPVTKNNNRLPIVSMFLVAVAAIGLAVFWNLPGDQYSQADRLPVGQSSSLENPVIVSTESESLAQAEVEPAAPVLADNTGDLDNVYASIETSSYETEAHGSYENAQYDLYKEPVQHNVDEPLNNEVTDSEAEMDVLPLEQNENEKSSGLLSDHANDADSSISELQLAAEKFKQLGQEQSASSISSEQSTTHLSKQPVSDLKDKTNNSWSIHLFAYRNTPPVSEFEFLETAEIPYEIKKTMIQGEVWYRVSVNTNSERSAAEKYAAMLKQKFAIKDIWLSKN